MPKEGYSSITVRTETYNLLRKYCQEKGLSMDAWILSMMKLIKEMGKND